MLRRINSRFGKNQRDSSRESECVIITGFCTETSGSSKIGDQPLADMVAALADATFWRVITSFFEWHGGSYLGPVYYRYQFLSAGIRSFG